MLTLCVKEPGGGSRELSLACGIHTIGRDKNNDIVLSDNYVSNTHAQITCEDNRFFIEDMEGTGGVYLDDAQISEKCRLENGATLNIGSTEIQVSLATSDEMKTMVMIPPDEDTTLLPENAANPKSEGEKDGTVVKVEEDKPIPEEENEANQDDTTFKFVDHHGMSPQNRAEEGSEIMKKGGKRALALVAAPIFLILAAFFYLQVNPAIKGLEKSKSEKKIDEISKLEKNSGESIVSDKALTEVQASREIIPRVAQNDPNHKAFDGEGKKTGPNEIRPSEDDASKANQLIRQGLAYYIKGKVEEALKELDEIASLNLQESDSLRTSAATYRQMIDQARTLYRKGERVYKQGHPEAAFQVWARVLEIDHRLIGQKSSHFSNGISEYMCSEYANQARRAFDNADYEEAYKNCQKALAIKPGLQSAIEIKNRLSERAEKLYGEAYILEELDPETAIRKWREILTISSPDNEFYKKASRRLANY